MSKVSETNKQSFQLKTDFLPFTVLQITSTNVDSITKQLEQNIAKTPKFFIHTPVVIDVDGLGETLDIGALCDVLRSKKIIPIGIRGISAEQQETAVIHGLAPLKKNQTLNLADGRFRGANSSSENSWVKTQHVTRPVRAGTQVYAKNGDLVVFAAVNAGGECVADGNIHIYGPLRGKVHAGASGDTNAHIFCQNLDAELIAIAGNYCVREKLSTPKGSYSLLHIFMRDGELIIEGV